MSALSLLLGLVCVVIFPSPQVRNHPGVVLAPASAACTLSCLWHCLGWSPAEGGLEEMGPQEKARLRHVVLARSAWVYLWETWSQFGELFLKWCLLHN